MAKKSNKVFIDSTIFISFIDRADINHTKAIKVMENIAQFNYQAFTSIQNIQEVYNLINREMGVSVALEFVQSALQSDIEILFPQKADLIAAYRLLRNNLEKQITLKESLNATLMEKRGIYQITIFTYWHNLLGTYASNLSV